MVIKYFVQMSEIQEQLLDCKILKMENGKQNNYRLIINLPNQMNLNELLDQMAEFNLSLILMVYFY